MSKHSIKKEKRKTEVLIIGSGALGSTFAHYLVRGGHQVTMLDAGPQLSALPGEHLRNVPLYQRSPDGFGEVIASSLIPISVPPDITEYTRADPSSFNPYSTKAVVKQLPLEGQNPDQKAETNLPDASSTYAVGGMVTHWTCSIPRPRGSQLLTEIPQKELSTLYDKAERLLNLHTDAFTHSPLNNVVSNQLSSNGFNVQPLPLAGARSPVNNYVYYTGAADILGAPLLTGKLKKNLTILGDHLCTRLNWRKDGRERRIVSAEVIDFARNIKVIYSAKKFIVACNAILTPQLLFNSDIWQDQLPALGRYLTEQPKFYGQVTLNESLVEKVAQLAPNPRYPKHDPIPFPASIDPPNLVIPPDPENGRIWHSQIDRDPSNEGLLPPGSDQRLIVQLRWYAPTNPYRSNQLTFSSVDKDRFGMPQPTFHFKFRKDAIKAINMMEPDFYRAAESLGGFFPGFEGRLQPPGNSLHYSGTTRIGHDPKTSVCDTYSKVWQFKNLYLGGNGMIPNGIAVNPTLTSVAIAIRAAERLAKEK